MKLFYLFEPLLPYVRGWNRAVSPAPVYSDTVGMRPISRGCQLFRYYPRESQKFRQTIIIFCTIYIRSQIFHIGVGYSATIDEGDKVNYSAGFSGQSVNL
jgi:hypothetical protein